MTAPLSHAAALRELRSLVSTYLEGSDNADRAAVLLDVLEGPRTTIDEFLASITSQQYEHLRPGQLTPDQERVFEEVLAQISPKSFAIEFRSGSYFENLEAERGCTVDRARRWPSRDEAEDFMIEHEWLAFNGGMVVEVPR